jgi:hypothetical protein
MREGAPRGLTWPRLVTASAAVVLLVVLGLAAWWVASSERRVTSYSVRGTLTAIELDLGNADAEIVGGREAPVVDVRRTDAFAFHRPAAAERRVSDGTLRLRSRCPRTVLGSCSASYRLTVPNNVPVTVRTASGDVSLEAFRGVGADRDRDGATCPPRRTAASSCAPAPRTATSRRRRRARPTASSCAAGRATCARWSRRAATGSTPTRTPGRRRIDGLTMAEDAPFQILALSDAGNVLLEAGP